MTITRAILIAAGRGRRLGAHTEEVPKCMVEVGGKPILGWVWDALRSAGIEELVVIRGYRGDVLERFVRDLVPAVRFVDNVAWQTNNVLLSLACALPELAQPCLISYSDILFTPAVAQAAVASPGEIALVIDRQFRTIYEGRTEHPLEEGEVADLMPGGQVSRVGKRALPPDQAVGEFIGLSKLGVRGAETVARTLAQLQAERGGRPEEPFQRAATYRNAYLTDLWQHLIESGVQLDPVLIDGGWREIDTEQDLERARAMIAANPDDWS